MKSKKPIDMLSPEEMQNEKVTTSLNENPNDYWDEKFAIEACSGASQGASCEWRDLNDNLHKGYCTYELSNPRRDLICRSYNSGTK